MKDRFDKSDEEYKASLIGEPAAEKPVGRPLIEVLGGIDSGASSVDNIAISIVQLRDVFDTYTMMDGVMDGVEGIIVSEAVYSRLAMQLSFSRYENTDRSFLQTMVIGGVSIYTVRQIEAIGFERGRVAGQAIGFEAGQHVQVVRHVAVPAAPTSPGIDDDWLEVARGLEAQKLDALKLK